MATSCSCSSSSSCSCASSSVQKYDLTSLPTIPESSITPILNVLPIGRRQMFYDINGHEPFVYILSERTSMVRPGYKKTVVRVLDMLSKSVIRTIDIEIQNIYKMHFCGNKYIIFHICEEEDDFYNKRDSYYIFEKTTFEFKYKIQFDYGEEFVLNISPNGKYFILCDEKELRLYSPEHGFISIMKIENSIFSDIDGFSRFEQICWKYDDSEFLMLENQTLVVYTINMPEPDTESETESISKQTTEYEDYLYESRRCFKGQIFPIMHRLNPDESISWIETKQCPDDCIIVCIRTKKSEGFEFSLRIFASNWDGVQLFEFVPPSHDFKFSNFNFYRDFIIIDWRKSKSKTNIQSVFKWKTDEKPCLVEGIHNIITIKDSFMMQFTNSMHSSHEIIIWDFSSDNPLEWKPIKKIIGPENDWFNRNISKLIVAYSESFILNFDNNKKIIGYY